MTRRTLFVVAAVAAPLLLLAAPAGAATYAVNLASDTDTGGCDAASCTLREAISAANATAADDVVQVPAGTYALTIAGTDEDANANGDLDVAATATAGKLTIEGAGMDSTIISASGIAERVLHVLDSVLTLRDVTVRDGNSTGQATTSGGGILLVNQTSTIERSRFTSNTSEGTGGGVQALGSTLTMSDSRVDHNASGGNGGGLHVDGNIVTTVHRSEFSSNSAAAGQDGGGIGVQANSGVVVNDSTVHANSAGANGGGVYTNTNGDITIVGSTITDNVADAADGAFGEGGGIFGDGAGAELNIANSIIAGNVQQRVNGVNAPEDCNDGSAGDGGVYTSTGVNIIGNDTNCDDAGTWEATDLVDTDPMLGTFGSNGGPTMSRPLLAGSPAIDKGGAAQCVGHATEQRGFDRVFGSSCDIGAVEAGNRADLRMVATPTSPSTVVGTKVEVTYALTNLGPDPAFGAKAITSIPSGFKFTATPTAMSCTGTADVTCTASSTIAAGATTTLVVALTPSATGTTQHDATASHLGSDPDTSNDTATSLLKTTSAVDRCSNLFGRQPTVPAGMLVRRGVCIGTARGNRLIGTNGRDSISGGGGNDTILGRGGFDTLRGGTGNDVLVGGAGNDRVVGDSGNDRLRGDAGNDVLDARDGHGGDVLACGAGSRDIAYVDRGDRTAGCEVVRRS